MPDRADVEAHLLRHMHPAVAELIEHELAERQNLSLETCVASGLLSKTLREQGAALRNTRISATSLIGMFAFDDGGNYALARLRRGAMEKARTLRNRNAHPAKVRLAVKCARGFARAEREFMRAVPLVKESAQHAIHAMILLADVSEPAEFPPPSIMRTDSLPLFLQHCVEAGGEYDAVALFV